MSYHPARYNRLGSSVLGRTLGRKAFALMPPEPDGEAEARFLRVHCKPAYGCAIDFDLDAGTVVGPQDHVHLQTTANGGRVNGESVSGFAIDPTPFFA